MTTRKVAQFLFTLFAFCCVVLLSSHLRRSGSFVPPGAWGNLHIRDVDLAPQNDAVPDMEAGVPDVPAPQTAEAPKPFRTRSRVDFYTIVGPADGLIALGEVSPEKRAAEKLDEGCATIPGRWVEMLEERDKYLLLRYFSGTPRMSAECPDGTTYLMEAAYYREMHDRYEAREEINP